MRSILQKQKESSLHPILEKSIQYLTEQVDEEMAVILVEESKNTFPPIFDTYMETFKTDNLKKAKEDIHALKGTFAAVGLKEESDLIIKIEKKLLANEIDTELEEFNKELSCIIDVFRE